MTGQKQLPCVADVRESRTLSPFSPPPPPQPRSQGLLSSHQRDPENEVARPIPPFLFMQSKIQPIMWQGTVRCFNQESDTRKVLT